LAVSPSAARFASSFVGKDHALGASPVQVLLIPPALYSFACPEWEFAAGSNGS